MALFLIVVSCVAGLLGGLTGIGGILIPPMLIGFAAISPHIAMGTTQASFFIPNILAIWMFARCGQLDMRLAAALSVLGAPLSFAGANLKPYLDAGILVGLLAVCIVAAGIVMLRPGAAGPQQRAFSFSRRRAALCALGGGVGLMAGITGSGANVLLVPAMLFLGIPPLLILAACQVYSMLICLFGTVGNFMHDAVDFGDAFWLTVGQLGGMWAGVRLAQRMNTGRLKKIMAWVCLLTGLFMLGRAGWGT